MKDSKVLKFNIITFIILRWFYAKYAKAQRRNEREICPYENYDLVFSVVAIIRNLNDCVKWIYRIHKLSALHYFNASKWFWENFPNNVLCLLLQSIYTLSFSIITLYLHSMSLCNNVIITRDQIKMDIESEKIKGIAKNT